MKRNVLISLVLLAPALACTVEPMPDGKPSASENPSPLTTEGLASVFSNLPIEIRQLEEVHDAVLSSAGNGFDEEYMLEDLINNPGSGVGDSPTKSSPKYTSPLRNLLSEYFSSSYGTKSGKDVEELMSELSSSGLQIYWPYSEDWDGETYPVITFDPGYGAESNIGFRTSWTGDGRRVVDTVTVDEAFARIHPVWVINSNDDSAYTPLDFFLPDAGTKAVIPSEETSVERHLMLKSFKMLRHYDSIFGGASEFFLKLGSVDGFTASTEAELKLYTSSVTDMMIVVRRKYLGTELPYDAILMTDFTNQIDKVAFLVTEDDGGTRTTWECEATVKWNSKSYGFAVKIPYNEKDDIVWRGRLAASFFQEADEVSGRFGDVVIKFALE